MSEFDNFKVGKQVSFPLYACSKEVIKKYKPFLDKADLTYTQYITMMVLWEREEINVKELGSLLYLDSGTLTPVLKKLEAKKYIIRKRSTKDERNLVLKITKKGLELREKVKDYPEELYNKYMNLTDEEIMLLHKITHKLLKHLSKLD